MGEGGVLEAPSGLQIPETNRANICPCSTRFPQCLASTWHKMGTRLIFAEEENTNLHKDILISNKEGCLHFIQRITPALITGPATK